MLCFNPSLSYKNVRPMWAVPFNFVGTVKTCDFYGRGATLLHLNIFDFFLPTTFAYIP